MDFRYQNYIDGEFCDAPGGRTLGVIDPATEEVFREVPYGDRAEAARAIEAAARAYKDWSREAVYKRCSMVLKVAVLIREHAGEMARELTREVGKPLAESKGEIMGAAAQFEWYAEEVKRRWGEWIPPSAPGKKLITMRMPVGVVAAIAPWNFPALLSARKIAPALACGCAVVAKSASQTPLATMMMFNLIHEAGFPKGVANLVSGPPGEISDEFVQNRAVSKISFTGSVPVGKELMAKSAERLVKLSLELGGHSPFIVCPDMDMDEAAERAVFGKFRNMGQVCISPTRFFVPEDRKAEFEQAAARRAGALRIGNGLEADTDVGPLHDKLRVASTEALIEDAVKKGAKVLAGGKKPEGAKYDKGFWFEPTVLGGVTGEMVLMKEEPFGPILPVVGYKDLDHAIEMANDTEFGLAGYVLTHDLSSAFKVAEGIEAGMIGVNDPSPAAAQAPFGGMKASGMGREGGHEGVEAYTETKFVSIVV